MTDGGKPEWITPLMVLAIHADQVRVHGGAPGLRDEALLDSALGRPRNRWSYGDEPDLADLAAAYLFGLVRNHPFTDGNKRTAFQVTYVFLGLNSYDLEADEAEVVAVMDAAAGGELDESRIADWLRARMRSEREDPQ